MKQYRRLERQHPIFSPVALISTILLALGLGIGVYFTGGQAFSPGDLSAMNNGGQELGGVTSHAALGNECQQCHTPFVGIKAAACESCHTNITQDRQDPDTLHGRIPNAADCQSCHLEHRGAEYDLKTAALVSFDHELARFSLNKHQLDYGKRAIACADCHEQAHQFTMDTAVCTDCHRREAPAFMESHIQAYSANCLACHDGQDSMAEFTIEAHNEKFLLAGKHLQTACENCHNTGKFAGTPQECVACHTEPRQHAGLFGTECAACHTAEAWLPAHWQQTPFEHAQTTGFSLARHMTQFNGEPFACQTCHTPDETETAVIATISCVDCHQKGDPGFMAEHTAQFGLACADCHDGTGRMADFDHAQVFPLDGRHAAQTCTACHVDQVFKGTPTECVACHAEPPIHAGLFGTDCANCHTTDAWLPARLRQHSFPLDHGEQGQLACATCHTGQTYTEYTCTTCHEHNEAKIQEQHDELDISQTELFACATCHPTGTKDEFEND